YLPLLFSLVFLKQPSTTEIYTFSLHDALPILKLDETFKGKTLTSDQLLVMTRYQGYSLRTLSYDTTITVIGALTDSTNNFDFIRSEEHTSELQSRENLVCRLLLEKKKRAQRGT